MMNFKKYPKYKKSGIAWLGEIPEHWKDIDVRKAFIKNEVKNKKLQEVNLLTLSYGSIKRKNIKTANGLLPASFDNYQILQKGMIVLRMLDLQNDKNSLRVGYVKEQGIITSAYIGLESKIDSNTKYFYYLLHFMDLIKHFYNGGGGVRQSIGYTDFRRELIILPKKTEQTAIANFLDYKLEKIDRFITKKKQLIELLKEQKAAIINQAVTKGLDKNAKMKPSGIEWLGDIPESWEVRNTFEYFINRKIKNVGLSNTNRLSLSYGQIIPKSILDSNGLVPNSYETYQIVEPGNIIFRFTDLQNDKKSLRTGLVNELGIITSAYVAIEPINVDYNSNYFHLLFHSYDLSKVFYNIGGGVRQSMSFTVLRKIKICCPSLIEQKKIVQYIETETTKIAKTISTIAKEIALVEEYKTALIAEAVTGKIDVRKWSEP